MHHNPSHCASSLLISPPVHPPLTTVCIVVLICASVAHPPPLRRHLPSLFHSLFCSTAGISSLARLTEEATNGNPWAPDTRTLKMISKAAFEVDDYCRILQILHNRLVKFDRKKWRTSYQALIVLDHLMTHGPESVAEEFQSDKEVIREMGRFQHIDEKGFNWGLNVRKKSEKILLLLDKGPFLKEERNRARKLSRGIQGFGSFSQRTSSAHGILHESPFATYARSNSQFIKNGDQEDLFSSSSREEGSSKSRLEKSEDTFDENVSLVPNNKMENFKVFDRFPNSQMLTNIGTQTSFKENVAPKKEHLTGDLDEWNPTGDSKPLLGNEKDYSRHNISIEEDHPFDDASVSLLSTNDRIIQAC